MPPILRPTEPVSYPTGSFEYLENAKNIDRNGDFTNENEADRANGHTPVKIKLDIVIVGAGIGGLSAAVALALDGHRVRIYEQAHELAEIGAGIQVPPNSGRILHSWGLEEHLVAKGVQPKNLFWRRWEDGTIIGCTRFQPDFEKWFGVPYYVVHRAHLHEMLHAKAVELGVEVFLGMRILKFDLEAARLHLMDETVSADLVVAADGIKSRARETINDSRGERLQSHDMAAYRATVPVDAMKADPLIRDKIDTDSVNWWTGGGSHVMSYGIVGSKSWNIVANVYEPREPKEWDAEENASVAHLQALYAGWDPTLTRLLSMITETSKWPVQDIKLPDQWISPSNTLVLLGDCAHGMLPFMSMGSSSAALGPSEKWLLACVQYLLTIYEGGAQAVEDAYALAQTLRLMEDPSQLGYALDVYQRVRRPRASAMHEASRRHAYTAHLPDGPEQEARDAAMADEVAGRHFIRSPNHFSDPTTQIWAYAYDAAHEIRRAWGS